MKRYLPLALLALTAAPARAETPSLSPKPGYTVERVDPRRTDIAITTLDGRVSLLLTGEALTMQLTDRALRDFTDEIERSSDPEAASGAGEFSDVLAASVRAPVTRAIQYDLHDVRSVRFEDGRLVITDRYGQAALERVETDGRPALESFAPEHAQAFVRMFNQLKKVAS